jgi:hypothetical protein
MIRLIKERHAGTVLSFLRITNLIRNPQILGPEIDALGKTVQTCRRREREHRSKVSVWVGSLLGTRLDPVCTTCCHAEVE